MGSAVCEAVSADPELSLVACVDTFHAGEPVGPDGLVAGSGPDVMVAADVDVAVDFTVAAAAPSNALWCAAHGVHAVIGTTGFDEGALRKIESSFAGGPANCIVAPNFAVGAVLMMRFAELAAPWFETVEVLELHHDGKLDAPSGTALLTAQRISTARASAGQASAGQASAGQASEAAAARGVEAAPGVRVHSVRLRGLVAHQEVLFGTAGQVLTIRHDALDRSSFIPGVLLAIKQVPHRPGFTLGLDALLGL